MNTSHRRAALKKMFAAAVVSATSVSLVEAAAAQDPKRTLKSRMKAKRAPDGSRALLRLKTGKSLELTKRRGTWYVPAKTAAAFRRSGRNVSILRLRNGAALRVDRSGKLLNGQVGNRSFLECVNPDCT